jgi:hypothetical protein
MDRRGCRFRFWKKGWFEQHQRLTAALAAQKNRAAISI